MKKQEYIKPNTETIKIETPQILAGTTIQLATDKDYGLIEDAGKADLPGKPTTYKTTSEFLKMFGYETLEGLPELPRYKLDANRQIVIDELVENQNNQEEPDQVAEKNEE